MSDDKDATSGASKDGYDDPPMTIWEHLTELRRRLTITIVAICVSMAIAWEFHEELLSFLVHPFAEAWIAEGLPPPPMLNFKGPAEAFLGYLKISLLGGLIFATPVIFYQLWSFITPGLYAREKKYIIPFVFFSSALFIGGGYFGWRAVFPIAFRYLLSFSGQLDLVNVTIAPTIMMNDYIAFVSRLLLGFGIVFEIPLFIFFLSISGIVNYLHLIHYGRWFVVGSFVAAAIITPPDVTTQVLMAVPMVLLYAVSIILAMIFGKPPSEAQRAAYKRRKSKPDPEPEAQ